MVTSRVSTWSMETLNIYVTAVILSGTPDRPVYARRLMESGGGLWGFVFKTSRIDGPKSTCAPWYLSALLWPFVYVWKITFHTSPLPSPLWIVACKQTVRMRHSVHDLTVLSYGPCLQQVHLRTISAVFFTWIWWMTSQYVSLVYGAALLCHARTVGWEFNQANWRMIEKIHSLLFRNTMRLIDLDADEIKQKQTTNETWTVTFWLPERVH